MLGAASLIDELGPVLSHGSPEQRSEVLRKVTNLFLDGSQSYSDSHVDLFDDIMCHLMEKIERHALIRLSLQLASLDNAPVKVVRNLAWNDDIAIAGPVIEKSVRIGDDDLVEIAKVKEQGHLGAIAVRVRVGEQVTDIIVERGNADVARKLAANNGARFSANGYSKIAKRASDDHRLAHSLVNRKDIPAEVFEQLLKEATETVRRQLAKDADPQMRTRINRVLSAVSTQVTKVAPKQDGSGYSVNMLMQLDLAHLKVELIECARAGKRTETIDILATMSKVPVQGIKNLLKQQAEEGVLILCKAIGLGWPDAKSVLSALMGPDEKVDYKAAFDEYLSLSAGTAHRVLRFAAARQAVSKGQAAV
jgi:uncharacterized protein (DUF2336 family)